MTRYNTFAFLGVINLLCLTSQLYAGRGGNTDVDSSPSAVPTSNTGTTSSSSTSTSSTATDTKPASSEKTSDTATSDSTPPSPVETSGSTSPTSGSTPVVITPATSTTATATPTVSTAASTNSNQNDMPNLAVKTGMVAGGLAIAGGSLALGISALKSGNKDKNKGYSRKQTQDEYNSKLNKIDENSRNRDVNAQKLSDSFSTSLENFSATNPHIQEALNQAKATHDQILSELKDVGTGDTEKFEEIRTHVNTMLSAAAGSIKSSGPATELLIHHSKALMNHVNGLDAVNGEKSTSSLQISHQLITIREGNKERNPYDSHSEIINLQGKGHREVNDIAFGGRRMHDVLNKKIADAGKGFFNKDSKLKDVEKHIQDHLNEQTAKIEQLNTESHTPEELKSIKQSVVESHTQLVNKLNEQLIKSNKSTISSTVSANLHVPREQHVVHSHIE